MTKALAKRLARAETALNTRQHVLLIPQNVQPDQEDAFIKAARADLPPEADTIVIYASKL
ncbi:MAG: hypothetical protein AAGI03_05210 [Pseudomonadota bacterium]